MVIGIVSKYIYVLASVLNIHLCHGTKLQGKTHLF